MAEPSLHRPASRHRPGRFPRGFLAWWTGELAGLASGRFAAGGPPLVVEVDDDAIRLRPPGGETVRLPPDATAADAARALARAGGRDRPIVLRLPDAQRLERTVRLPRAAEEDLRQVLGLEMDRQTPFRAEQVHFGHEVTARDAREIRVRLWLVPREIADRRLERLRRLGIRPDRVEAAPGEALPVTGPARQRAGMGSLNRGLLAAAIGLAIAWAVLPPVLAGWRADALAAEVAAARAEVDAVRALAAERDRLAGGAAAAVGAKAAAPSTVRLLEELSRILPDDTFLGQFNVVDGLVEIEGSTASAAALVPRLEASAMFAAVRFRAPVAAEAVSRRERFHFALELAQR